MKSIRRLAYWALGILILMLPAFTRAAEVLQNVPHDALGFVVIKNLNATDAKAIKLLKIFDAKYPPPLVFLEAVTGIREALDAQGDFLVAMLPSNNDADLTPQYCVWLPVTDYDRLLTLHEATPGDSISAIRIADEDLLVAQQGNWALLMDPDQRPRMEQMLKAEPSLPAAVAAWTNWIDGNDVAVVLLRSGIEQVLRWSADPPKSNKRDAEEPEDDLFGQLDEPVEDDPFVDLTATEALQNPLYDPIRSAVHKWVVRFPRVREVVSHAEAIGAAVHLDDAGNAIGSLRLKPTKNQTWNSATDADNSLPPALFEKGDFIVNGGGRLPPVLLTTVASFHVRRMLDDLKTTDRIELERELAANFEEAFAIAASEITAWTIVHQPGDLKTGVHNNNFFVLRVPSARTFLDHAANAMEQWNTMHRESESETKYVFDIEESKLGNRLATQYLLDVGATGGIPALPEMRQLMERFFGPGGKMRLWIVPVDEKNVLLATATPEQVTSALEVLDRRRPIDWNDPELAAANRLLPETTDWRVFFSPRGYYAWKRRESEAMNAGVRVIGAKPARDFPTSPPMVVSGTARENQIEVNAAISADTITSAGTFFKQ